jgi:hypothetical protein
MKPILSLAVSGAVAGLVVAPWIVVAQAPGVGERDEARQEFVNAQRKLVQMRDLAKFKAAAAPVPISKASNRQRLVLNLTNQYAQHYHVELLHARSAGGLSKDQLKRIRPEADKQLGIAIEQLVDDQLAWAQARKPGAKPLNRPNAADVIKRVQTVVSGAVKAHATPEQWTAYVEDLAHRDQSRKEAGVRYCVAALDRQVMLSVDQRTRLIDSLSSHWDDAWSSALAQSIQGSASLPPVPGEYLTPILSESQLKTYRSLQKYTGWPINVVGDPAADSVVDQALGGQPRVWPPEAGVQERLKFQKAVVRDLRIENVQIQK